jgi:basic membrane lipoprotein Med (substrate-binding protein (PBP1-ABC) superfamily)
MLTRKQFTLGLAASLAGVLAFGCAGSDNLSAAQTVALILSGSANDGGWNESAALGLDELRAEGYTTSVVQNVTTPNQVAELEAKAAAGNRFVIAHGTEFTSAVADVSARYPTVNFIQTNGTQIGPNWRSLSFSEREIGYVMGYMAGLTSPSGKVGLILQEDESAATIAAVLHGVTDANASATLNTATTVDFDTPSYGQEAAESLLALGVDSFVVLVDGAYAGVHTAIGDIAGVQAFRLRSVPGLPTGQPEVLGGVVLNSGGLFNAGIQAFNTGQPTSAQVLGFKDEALALSNFGASYPASARAEVEDVVLGIINGTITP